MMPEDADGELPADPCPICLAATCPMAAYTPGDNTAASEAYPAPTEDERRASPHVARPYVIGSPFTTQTRSGWGRADGR